MPVKDSTDRTAGSILGLALGDAFGATFEGGIIERALWSLIGKTGGRRRFTDDTQMTIDLIESLVACCGVDQDDLAARFARSYRWSRGYGKGMAASLRRIREGMHWKQASKAVFPEGSFGNGGAMRAPAVGLYFHGATADEIKKAANDTAAVTHAHPEGREGSVMIALAVSLAFNDAPDREFFEILSDSVESQEHRLRIKKASELAEAGFAAQPRAVASILGNGVRATDSCGTAVYAALAFREKPFEDLLSFAIGVGGDTDTISAMACAIWGAANGASTIPEPLLARLEQRERIDGLALSLARAAGRRC